MIVKGRSRGFTPHYLHEQCAFATVTFATVTRPFLVEKENFSDPFRSFPEGGNES